MSKTLALKPIMSEKAYAMSQANGTYVFGVAQKTTVHEVARAVIAQYKVGVAKVRISTLPGKKKTVMRRKTRLNRPGQRNDVRKAYVTLKEGDKLPIFAAVEEAEKKEAAAEAKAAKKEKK